MGEAWILSEDEPTFRGPAHPHASARLLPSGDQYFLLWGADRDLVVAEADRRGALWTPRVWPGAILVAGEIVGTWRRAGAAVTIQSWRRLSRRERDEVQAEVDAMPLAGVGARVINWEPM